MKKKQARIERDGGRRPKVDKEAYDRLVAEISRPERLAEEVRRLAERLRDEAELLDLRFDPDALARAAAEVAAGKPEGDPKDLAAETIARLATADLRERALETLDRLARRSAELAAILPYRVGGFLLGAEREGTLAPRKNAVWIAVLQASALDAPVALHVRERLAEDAAALRTDLAAGGARARFERFLADDARARAIARVLPPAADFEAILIHLLLGLEGARELALPLEAALSGPIEAARAARRQQALVGIGAPAGREAESMKVLQAALAKDAARAIPAFREALLERWDEAARPPAAARAIRVFAALLALEMLPPERNLPLLAAYEAAGPRAVEEATAAERPLLHAILARPLDKAGYRAYTAWLAGEGGEPARAKAFARAALDALGEDPDLAAIAGTGP